MSRFKSLLSASLLAGLFGFGLTHAAFAETTSAEVGNITSTPRAAEQRVALVIGNSNYRNAPPLANPGNDAQSISQLLNSAGFEVTEATDLTQNDMVKVLQDFSVKISGRGPNTVAMIYYAGHGVQLAGENYLIPVDAKISAPSDLTGQAVRLVDVMGTLETIPSRMRIVVLDACRNNPFPAVNDSGRGLAIVDAPNGSIVGYSTAPGMEAQDGDGNHSPYTSAFLHLAREPNLPIEQLFKRVRLEVNNSTAGRQTPWESSSLTSDFTFFGDTAVASARAPDRSPIMQTASNLPSRSVRQAYDYVLAEGTPERYREFIELFPNDPLCDRVRFLLGNIVQATAWHKTVLANSPLAYKTFYDNNANSPYAQSALRLQAQPKLVPLMQFSHLTKSPAFRPISGGPLNGGQFHGPLSGSTRIVTLAAPGNNTAAPLKGGSTDAGKTLPVKDIGKAGSHQDLKTQDLKTNGAANHRPQGNMQGNIGRGRMGGEIGNKSQPRLVSTQSRGSFNAMGRMGGGGHGGFRH
jgi:hypothetical protein